MSAGHVLLLFVVTLVGMPAVVLAHRFNPLKVCPSCKGTKRRGAPSARRVCKKCGGDGEIRRMFAPRR